ncbi:CinA family protein [Arthrobacter castelli]|uniref:CinA family protein n=1 Tax=Arthrobacter castelli TaxID=271431 RepID=UPI000404409C|nr:CinA family protein [Arthrobacter castelli]
MIHQPGHQVAAPDVERIVADAASASLTVATAESLTAGMVCAELAGVPGASTMLVGAVVAYQNPFKESVLGVSAELLSRAGSVDAEVARAMAQGVRRLSGASLGLSTTGVAGPEPHDGQPVGTVFIALADEYGAWCAQYSFEGDRAAIRRQATAHALLELQQAIDAAGPPAVD